MGEKREREGKENTRMFTSGFALGSLSLDKKCGSGGIILDLLVGGGGQGGDSKQKGSKRRCLLCHIVFRSLGDCFSSSCFT